MKSEAFPFSLSSKSELFSSIVPPVITPLFCRLLVVRKGQIEKKETFQKKELRKERVNFSCSIEFARELRMLSSYGS